MILPTEFKIFTIERGITCVSLPRSRISRKRSVFVPRQKVSGITEDSKVTWSIASGMADIKGSTA